MGILQVEIAGKNSRSDPSVTECVYPEEANIIVIEPIKLGN